MLRNVSYVTDKTDKDWDSFKEREPEKAARILNNPATDMNTNYKSNPLHQKESLILLATVFKCEVSEVEHTYKAVQRELLTSKQGTVEQYKQSIKDLKQEKYKQAVKMKFDPDNTPAAFMERWMKEILEELSKPKINIKYFLIKAASLTSRNQHREAISILAKGVEMIANGDLSDDERLSPNLFNYMGENFLMLKEFSNAYIFFEQAINQLNKVNPSNKEDLKKFLQNKEEADEKFVQSGAYSRAESVLEAFDRETRSVKPNIDTEDLLMKASPLASANQHEDVLELVANTLVKIASGELIDNSNDNLVSFLFNAKGESLMVLNKFDGAYKSFDYAISKFKNINQDNENALRRIIKRKFIAYDKTDKSVVFSNPI